jgi:hypothetical protein
MDNAAKLNTAGHHGTAPDIAGVVRALMINALPSRVVIHVDSDPLLK